MIPEITLNAEELRAVVQEAAYRRFSLRCEGYEGQTTMVYNVLLKAAAERIRLEMACADLTAVADSNTIHGASRTDNDRYSSAQQSRAYHRR